MLGILVSGDNHFIVEGPVPDRQTAIALVRHWTIIRIGAPALPPLARWQIVSKAYRENLQWAVIVAGDGAISPAVQLLLEELATRGLAILDFRFDTR
jgi:hypothetical protein